ncbi:MAG: DUF1549 domain-containing protein, partial [Akkermansiaceae bacterium]|nr:DUF1549 domain-containing protein [Akkermansiaceae bacterium]
MNTISRILFFTLGVSGPLCSQVHPVIIDNCTKCHGGVKQKGGLDLRTLESAIEGGDTDTALIPGAPDKSPLFQSLQVGSDPHMPPKKQLTPEEINALRDWISTAKLTPPKELVLPGSKLPTSQVVDQLVARKWQQENVTPAKTTDDPTFARRIYLDLLGRIPKPDELQAFLANPDRNKLINSLTETEEHAAHLTEIFNVVFLD